MMKKILVISLYNGNNEIVMMRAEEMRNWRNAERVIRWFGWEKNSCMWNCKKNVD